nr:MAG TPA: hypothetical protein [Caudoviricetes sp.]
MKKLGTTGNLGTTLILLGCRQKTVGNRRGTVGNKLSTKIKIVMFLVINNKKQLIT